MEHQLMGVATILILGIGAQWLAWRLHLPSILLLLLCGFLAGPVTGFLDPDQLMGDLLFPVVSLSVAIILFEGGLSLNLSDLPRVGGVIWKLISIGALTSLVLTAAAAYLLLGLSLNLSILLGGILVVTGPTVIVPMLRHIRPRGEVGSILRWEGIVIDPIGAMLAVLLFEAILVAELQQATTVIIGGVLKTLAVGMVLGLLAAALLVLAMKRYWIPDLLENPVSVMLVVAAFTVSNLIQEESGLLTVTVMGIAMANQKKVSIEHIVEFKENLQVLLLSALFILLSARLQMEEFRQWTTSGLAFLAVMVVLVRPASVFLATLRSRLQWRERLFLSWMAPRGIVAAAVASLFSLRLVGLGYGEAQKVFSITFLVILGTILVYGLSARPLALRLHLATPNPQGLLMAGAHPWARQIARAVQDRKFRVLLVDTNWRNIVEARQEGMSTFHGNILSQHALDEIDLDGLGRLVALTSNDEVNSLAALHFTEVFGRSEVYQLPTQEEAERPRHSLAQRLRGRLLFGPDVTYERLESLFTEGAEVETREIQEEREGSDLREEAGFLPLFVTGKDRDRTLLPCTVDNPVTLRPGQVVIGLRWEVAGKPEPTREVPAAAPSSSS